jgi:hypothetical protein
VPRGAFRAVEGEGAQVIVHGLIVWRGGMCSTAFRLYPINWGPLVGVFQHDSALLFRGVGGHEAIIGVGAQWRVALEGDIDPHFWKTWERPLESYLGYLSLVLSSARCLDGPLGWAVVRHLSFSLVANSSASFFRGLI